MARVSLEILGKDKASGAVKGVTTSIITAQLAVEAIKVAITKMVDISKEAIEKYTRQEKALNRLGSVLESTGHAAGMTANELIDLSESLSDVTKFGDEAVLEAQNLLLTFTKVGGDVFPRATETILNMSEAMGSDLIPQTIQLGKALNDPEQGISALSRVGVQLSEVQKKQIKDFMAVNDVASAQGVILDELEVQFGGAARSARETFGGALAALENVQGDILESGGKIISIFGTDIVNSMVDAGKAVNEFISDVDNIAPAIATFEVLGVILKDIVNAAVIPLQKEGGKLLDRLKNLVSVGDDSIGTFDVLGGIVKILGIGFSIMLKTLSLIIQPFLSMAEVMKQVIELGVSMWKVLKGEGDFDAILKNAKDIGLTYANAYAEMGKTAASVVTDTIDQFKTFNTEVESSADKYQTTWSNANKRVRDEYEKVQDEIIDKTDETGDEIEKKVAETASKVGNTWTETWDVVRSEFGQKWDSMNFDERMDAVNKKWDDTWKKMSKKDKVARVVENINAYLQVAADFAVNIGIMIMDAWNNMYDSMIAKSQESMEKYLEQVDEWVASELEKQGAREETESERLQARIDKINETLGIIENESQIAATKEELRQLESQKKRIAIEEEGERKKQKIQEDAKKKETALKKKQFEENKKWAIAQVWINAAVAIMGWMASLSSLSIAGIVLVAIQTALTLALAGAQTGVIASQTFHAIDGGVTGTHSSVTGESIPVMTRPLERVLTPEQNKAFEEMVFGDGATGKNIVVNVWIDSTQIPIKERTIELQDLEAVLV